MALFYDLGALLHKREQNPEAIDANLITFVEEANDVLLKVRKNIDKKNYEKVYKHILKLKGTVELLAMEEAMEEALVIVDWTKTEGKVKTIKEIFKSFDKRVKGAVKEVKKDFNIKEKV
ncbi:MAG: histidine kinase [Flavobacteriaceae bacterium]|jgi:thiamine kinase-like enzyme|nr:histidine kinase [Flavobacteriaceae bacterium]